MAVDPYVQPLVDTLSDVVAPWLERCVVGTAQRCEGACRADLRDEAARMAATAAPIVLAELQELLETDAVAQRTSPLSVIRASVRFPTRVLAAAGVGEVRRDDFAIRAFPADVYDLSPATWADVDARLVEPGLVWGAWKAKTILDRRRRPPV